MSAVRGSSKSGLFLIEFIIAVAFFALSSGVCIQLFVKAHSLSTGSSDLTMAVGVAQSAAECFKATQADGSQMAHILQGEAQQSQVRVYYDKEWQPVAQQQAAYSLTVTMGQDADTNLADAQIVVAKWQSDQPIYTLSTKKYISP